MKTRIISIFVLLLMIACNSIETHESLDKTDIERIRKLNLPGENENIHKFYSEYTNKVAGNFFTDKRMAKYWIGDSDSTENEVSFAFYHEIIAIDTVYNAGDSYCPYMLVTKSDSSQFKVCVDGKRKKIKAFFEDALKMWQEHRDAK